MNKLILNIIVVLTSCFLFSCKSTVNQEEPVDSNIIQVATDEVLNQNTIELGHGIVATVTETKNAKDSLSDITIETKNSKVPFKKSIDQIGNINKVFVQDADQDGFNELYILTKPAYSGVYGRMLVFAVDTDRSIRPVMVRDIGEEEKKEGIQNVLYDAEDTFYTDTSGLVRKFKIFEATDTAMKKSIGYNNVIYKLDKTSDPWFLRIKSNSFTKE